MAQIVGRIPMERYEVFEWDHTAGVVAFMECVRRGRIGLSLEKGLWKLRISALIVLASVGGVAMAVPVIGRREALGVRPHE